eukprot:GHVL01010708.1.p1 GENE.GHVL01010708.1~~GHVL01010708.1.p1  ORF type:complete len:203 (-),score=-11.54 GHVL01010708.1:1006-1614(-)
MGRGTYIPPRGLREGCFVTAGGRKNHSFDLLTGKPLRKQNLSEFATEDERMPPQSPPLGVPRERCPFSVRVRGVSIRVSRTSVVEYLIDRAHLTPDSDASRPRILFSCLCKLLGKEIFIKHRSLVERSVLPTRSESTTFIPSVMWKKLSSLTKPHFREDVRPETQRLSNAPPGLPRPPVIHTWANQLGEGTRARSDGNSEDI